MGTYACSLCSHQESLAVNAPEQEEVGFARTIVLCFLSFLQVWGVATSLKAGIFVKILSVFLSGTGKGTILTWPDEDSSDF